MRYCPKCDLEYQDASTVCSEDGTALLDQAAYESALRRSGDVPNRMSQLITVLTASDRFEAEELAEELLDSGLDVALVSNKMPTLGTLTTPGPEMYSVVVPDHQAARAQALLAEWKPNLEASRAAAEQAAVDEEAETERTTAA